MSPDPDRAPAGDPRDPRLDGVSPRPRDRRRLPRWPFVVLAVLTVTAFASQPRLLLADLGLTVDALGFAVLVGAPLVIGVLWADRRWPAERRRDGPSRRGRRR